MTHDAALEFNDRDGNAITADVTLGDIDFSKSDIGSGNPLWLIVVCTADGVNTGEVSYQLRTDNVEADLATGAVILNSGELEAVDQNAGEMLYAAPLPVGSVLGWVRLRAEVTGTVTGLEVRAWIGSAPQTGMGIRTPIAASS